MTDWKAKILSGRFWLAIITGIVFGVVSLTGGDESTPYLTNEQVTGVVMLVFLSYFNRNRNDDTNSTKY